MVSTVSLTCGVQFCMDDTYTNVEVKWYRSTNELTAGIEGERLTQHTNHFTLSTGTTSQSNGKNTTVYNLEIRNFNESSDTGYYWCQIVVNNTVTSLSPSPYGYIYSSDCIFQDVTCDMRAQPLCAQNLTSIKMARTLNNESSCNLEDSKNKLISTTISLTDINMIVNATLHISNTITSHHISPIMKNIITTSTVFNTDATVKCNFSRRGYLCSIGALLGVILVIIVCLLIISITFFYCRRGNKKGNLKVR